MNIQKLFKPYIVKRKNGQCQVLIPLIELDELCERIISSQPTVKADDKCCGDGEARIKNITKVVAESGNLVTL